MKGITLSKENNGTFDSFASLVAFGILIWFVLKLIKAIAIAVVDWFISNQAILYHLFLIAIGLAVACSILYAVYSYICWSVQHARDTDATLASMSQQIQKAVSRLDDHRSTLYFLQNQIDELRELVNGIDQFTGFNEHRAILEKAKAAEAEVTGQTEDADGS